MSPFPADFALPAAETPPAADAAPEESLPCALVVVAAGQGRRVGGPLPKQYLPLAGVPVLLHTLRRLHAHPLIDPIQPVIAADGLALWEEWIGPHLAELPRVRPPVFGGAERQDSVLAGLRALDPPPLWVGIHDAARPLVSLALLQRLLEGRRGAQALIPALPIADTVKRSLDGTWIHATEERSQLWLAQTPQFFRHATILAAHARPRQHPATDDAALMEEMGLPVRLIPGDPANLKITRPEDLPLAAWRLARETTPDVLEIHS
ncbi:MAG: 2-C-methyl-D-erythritol 4-phosphate cytidylyltransferase [Magnetococcales bacterium]|nr:2-C-methyl-D-erythritol 4-phosphate cytidylyltransferase [Magnetococcales bacterium]